MENGGAKSWRFCSSTAGVLAGVVVNIVGARLDLMAPGIELAGLIWVESDELENGFKPPPLEYCAAALAHGFGTELFRASSDEGKPINFLNSSIRACWAGSGALGL